MPQGDSSPSVSNDHLYCTCTQSTSPIVGKGLRIKEIQPYLHPEPLFFSDRVNTLKPNFVFTTGLIL